MFLSGKRVLLGLSLFAIASILLLLVPIPCDTLLCSALQNSAHSLLFAWLTLSALTISDRTSAGPHSGRLPPVSGFIAVVVTVFVFGVLIEIVQGLVGRSTSSGDLLMNSAGITAGILVHVARRYRAGKRALGSLFYLAAAAVLLLGFRVPMATGLAMALRTPLPVIANFDDPLAATFIAPTGQASLSIVEAPEGWGSNTGEVLKMDLGTGTYPGFTVAEPYGDWTGFASFSVRLYSLDSEAFPMVVRIHDHGHDNRPEDRFERRVLVVQGENEIDIPIGDIEALADRYSRHRKMNLREIAEIILYRPEPSPRTTLYVDDVRLD